MSDLPPLPEGFVLDNDQPSFDPMQEILSSGFDFTNGYRTPEDIERLRREGYKPAAHSKHLEGDAIDLVPGKSGKSLSDVRSEADRILAQWGKGGRVIDEGDHIHLQLDGWGQAPGTPGTPYSGMPDLPPGFTLEQRGPVSKEGIAKPAEQPAEQPNDKNVGIVEKKDFADSATYLPDGSPEFADAMHGLIASGKVKGYDDLVAAVDQYNKAHGTDWLAPKNDEQAAAGFKAAAEGKTFGYAPPRYSKTQFERLQARSDAAAESGRTSATVAGGADSASLGAFDEASALADATGDALQGKGFDYTGNLNADREFLHGVEEAHPNYYIAGQLAGGLVLPTFGDMKTVAGMAKTGAVEGGAYGFNSGEGSLTDRAEGAAMGAGVGTVAGPIVGKLIEGAGAAASPVIRRVFGSGGEEAPPIPEGFVPEEAAGAPPAGETAPEAVGQPNATEAPPAASQGVPPMDPEMLRKVNGGHTAASVEEAAMQAEPAPSVASEPLRQRDTINVNQPSIPEPGTPEQRAAAMAAKPEDLAPGEVAPPDEQALAPTAGEPDRAANINLDKLYSANATPEDIRAAMKFTARTFGDFADARRGIQKWEQTDALAGKLGMSVDDLLSRGTGEAWNAERIEGANRLLDASAQKLVKLRDAAIGGGEAEQAQFVKGLLVHAAVTEQAAGLRAEAGRALNILRKVSKSGLNDRAAIDAAVKRLDAGASVEEIADMVGSLKDDPTGLNSFVRNMVKPRFRDKLTFLWIMARLSSPKTHIVNTVSNLVTAAADLPEHAIAAAIGAARRIAGGSNDAVYLSELGPRAYGMLRGGAEGLSEAKEAFGVLREGGGIKADQSRIPLRNDKGEITLVGKVASAPARLLNAEDAFFKGIAHRSELLGLAVRKARMEGLKGEQLQARIDQLAQHPSDDMLEAAAEAGLYKTFQNDPGPLGNALARMNQEVGWTKLFIPFIRTPTNLIKYAVARSPAAPLLAEVRRDFIAGGAKRDIAIARMMFGTGIGATTLALAGKGLITGEGPADPSALRALRANGWQPYSIKIGDKYYSYARLDPWATTLGVAANLVEKQSKMTEKQQHKVAALLFGSIIKNLSSKTFLSGMSDSVNAITDPDRNAETYLAKFGSSFATTSLTGAIEQAMDPVFRDTNGDGLVEDFTKQVLAHTPVASTDLIARRDIFGNEIKSEDGPVGRLLSPYTVSSARHDEVAQAIFDSGARVSVPSRQVGGGRLPDDAYDMYQQLAGQYFHNDAKGLIADPEWKTLDKPAQAKAIEKAKNDARKRARSELFGMSH